MERETRSRTTISIPAALKKRMERVKEPINWSSLACLAFEAKLNDIQKRQEVRKMSDVIERLRASKQESQSHERKAGFEVGQTWAKQSAEFFKLQNLSNLRDRLNSDPSYGWDEFFDSTFGSSAFNTCDHLYFELNPDDDNSRNASAQFWEDVADDKVGPMSDEWVRGFAEGALAIFDEVADQL